MKSQATKQNHSTLYNGAGLIYIRAPSRVETKTNKQKKIRANPYPPDRHLITEQPKYGPGDGDYFALLMGREFRPGRFVILLDFDNKEADGAVNGMQLIKKLRMSQYGAPCQRTPSDGEHYLFYVDASQKDSITDKNTIMYEGVKYNMDVKFKNALCTCAPTKIEGYGNHAWTKGSFEKCKTHQSSPTSFSK